MKASVKAKRAPKRDLFVELSEGMGALAQAREGKRTLRTHAVEFKPAPEVTPKELVRVRERCSPSICAPTSARWRTGNRAVPSRMRKQRC